MKTKTISAVLALLGATLVFLACAQQHKEAQTSQSSGSIGAPKGTLLVKQLPADVQGVELKNGMLRLKPGFVFEKKPKHQFVVALTTGGGGSTTSGGCGCTGGTCDPVNRGGIIVCEGSNCTGKCGLALTLHGVRTRIMEF
jgi:hypothetical protein